MRSIFNGPGNVTAPDNISAEIQRAEEEIAATEERIARASEAVEQAKQLRDDLTFRRNVHGARVGDDIDALTLKIDASGVEIVQERQKLRDLREYLAKLERPLLEAELTAADAALPVTIDAAERARQAAVAAIRACAVANREFRIAVRDARQAVSARNGLARRLGEAEVNAPNGQNIVASARPRESVLSGSEETIRAYDADLERLDRAIERTRT